MLDFRSWTVTTDDPPFSSFNNASRLLFFSRHSRHPTNTLIQLLFVRCTITNTNKKSTYPTYRRHTFRDNHEHQIVYDDHHPLPLFPYSFLPVRPFHGTTRPGSSTCRPC